MTDTPQPLGDAAELGVEDCPDEIVDAVRRATTRCETVTVARVVGTVAGEVEWGHRLDTLVKTTRVVLDDDTPITADGRATIGDTAGAGEIGTVVDA
jgi:hypothetical protein